MTSRHVRRVRAAVAGVVLLASPIVPGTSAAYAHADPTRPPAVADTWKRSESLRLQGDASLTDVAGLSATDVWAVGQQAIWDVWANRGAIAHWDGRAWTQVGIRNDDTGAGQLRSIAAASPGDLWTVGTGHDNLPYVAHGDGSAFDRVSVDQLRPGDWLAGVAAVPGRMVAVGSRDGRALVLTRTAAGSWKVETGHDGTLYGVAIDADGDGWAVGDDDGRPLIMKQSDGGAWKALPAPGIPGGYLRDVQIDGSRDALAVGGVYGAGGKVSPLVLAWEGKRWSRVRLPDADARLYGVTGDRDGRYWVSGYDPGRPGQGFVLRIDGRSVKVMRGDEGRTPRTIRLQAVGYLPGTSSVWAVGHTIDANDVYADVVEKFGPKDPDDAAS